MKAAIILLSLALGGGQALDSSLFDRSPDYASLEAAKHKAKLGFLDEHAERQQTMHAEMQRVMQPAHGKSLADSHQETARAHTTRVADATHRSVAFKAKTASLQLFAARNQQGERQLVSANDFFGTTVFENCTYSFDYSMSYEDTWFCDDAECMEEATEWYHDQAVIGSYSFGIYDALMTFICCDDDYCSTEECEDAFKTIAPLEMSMSFSMDYSAGYWDVITDVMCCGWSYSYDGSYAFCLSDECLEAYTEFFTMMGFLGDYSYGVYDNYFTAVCCALTAEDDYAWCDDSDCTDAFASFFSLWQSMDYSMGYYDAFVDFVCECGSNSYSMEYCGPCGDAYAELLIASGMSMSYSFGTVEAYVEYTFCCDGQDDLCCDPDCESALDSLADVSAEFEWINLYTDWLCECGGGWSYSYSFNAALCESDDCADAALEYFAFVWSYEYSMLIQLRESICEDVSTDRSFFGYDCARVGGGSADEADDSGGDNNAFATKPTLSLLLGLFAALSASFAA